MNNRTALLSDLVKKIEEAVGRNFGHSELAQEVWDVANALSSHEDSAFRDYLKWLEGNLDGLIHLTDSQEIIDTFLVDQVNRIKQSLADERALTVEQWKNALAYVKS